MSSLDDTKDINRQSDALLWLGGAIVAGMGVTWLLLAKPWTNEETSTYSVAAAADAADESEVAPAARLEAPLEDNPLRMAQLALDAGMLVEPEEYSAWTLFRRALQQDPNSREARQGLERIADELLRRAHSAVEQGRFDDARATVTRIRDAIPVHPGANDLAIRIDALARRAAPAIPVVPQEAASEEAAPPAETVSEPEERVAEAAAPIAAEPLPEPVNPILATHEAFAAALAANELLTPMGASAKDYVGAMLAIDRTHELTQQARRQLFDRLLARARQAIVEMDTVAAETWLDEAEILAVDAARVTAERGELRARLIEAESTRRVPASSLRLVSYSPPEYPARALERAIDGWVDIDFVVAKDGTTRQITVTDASHNTYFRNEAVAAIERWRFEPRIFMDEPIEQRAFTRIRFDTQ